MERREERQKKLSRKTGREKAYPERSENSDFCAAYVMRYARGNKKGTRPSREGSSIHPEQGDIDSIRSGLDPIQMEKKENERKEMRREKEREKERGKTEKR